MYRMRQKALIYQQIRLDLIFAYPSSLLQSNNFVKAA